MFPRFGFMLEVEDIVQRVRAGYHARLAWILQVFSTCWAYLMDSVTYQYGCRLQWSWSVIVCKGDPRKIMQTTPAEAREGPRTTIGNNRPLARQPNLWITKVGEQRG